MKKTAILSLSALLLAGCGGTAATDQPAANNANRAAQNANSAVVTSSKRDDSFISSHSSNNSSASSAPSADGKTKWTQSGNPIDTTAFDAAVKSAEVKQKASPTDEAAKKALADAYVKRGIALTDARQYASALGDYRRALKLDPANEEAKTWIDQIIGIYESINRDYPKEGEEPPPLPFKKEG